MEESLVVDVLNDEHTVHNFFALNFVQDSLLFLTSSFHFSCLFLDLVIHFRL